MTVSIVVAYRDLGDPHRRAAWAYVHGWYSATGWEMVLVGDVEPFGRAAAINAGVRRASGSVIVQTDPDSLVDLGRLDAAVLMAAAGDGLVVPHDRYLYLNQAITAQVLAGGLHPSEVGPAHCDDAGPDGLGNVVVFSRSTWERAGGFDERFGLWGGDDAAFGYACDAMVGPRRRLPGDMVHLWHPRLPQSVPGHPGYLEQMTILGQYRDAAAIGPDAVRALVAGR